MPESKSTSRDISFKPSPQVATLKVTLIRYLEKSLIELVVITSTKDSAISAWNQQGIH